MMRQKVKKKKITVFRSMEFHKELLHAIIDHLNFVISHHPDSHKSNTTQLEKDYKFRQ